MQLLKRLSWLTAIVMVLNGLGSQRANAALTYTCDPSVSTVICTTLQTTIASLYNNTFTNIDADDYVTMGSTGLGDNEQYLNFASYTDYLTALTDAGSSGLVRTDALASLGVGSSAYALYSGGSVQITAALATSLGFTGATGITSTGASCPITAAGCYDDLITISNTASLYDRVGVQPAGSYDVYSVVEHETDESLGTSSCIGTTAGSLVNECGTNIPSVVDLFRCHGSSHVLLSGATGAYFSYNGCASNGGDGAVYNTLANGDDYADFISSSPCQTTLFIQDGTGCPGYGGGLDITNDGPGGTDGPEITILAAEGYNVPEPMSLALMLSGVIGLIGSRRRGRGAMVV